MNILELNELLSKTPKTWIKSFDNKKNFQKSKVKEEIPKLLIYAKVLVFYLKLGKELELTNLLILY